MTAPIVNQSAPEKRRLDAAQESAANVGRDLVAKVELLGLDLDLHVGIPDHEIGVESGRDLPLASAKTGQRRRASAHPGGDLAQGPAATLRLRPNGRQTELQRRDPAPGLREVAPLPTLEGRRTWAVIADHEIDHPFF